jgi:hypothetical protein
MKKITLFTLLIITTFQLSFAQNTIAKLKYEEAEEAYANNNFELALSKLKDVELLLKSTSPKILYLKINSQSKIIKKKPLGDYAIIENARIAIEKYLKEYDNLKDYENQYRDIYKISESLKKYLITRQEFDERIKETELRAAKQAEMLKSGFKFSDETYYEMGTIKGQNGECKIESFAGSESTTDNYAHTSLKINKSEYWGGECKDGYLNGLVLMTVHGDKKQEKQNILAYFVNGRISYPFLSTYVYDSDQLSIGIEELDSSYGCLYVGSETNWNNVDKLQMCVKMKEIYGEQIFSLDFMRNFKHGNIDLKELEKKFKDFITSGKKITRE